MSGDVRERDRIPARFCYALKYWGAGVFAWIPFHSSQRLDEGDQRFVVKRRSLLGRILIPFANLYLLWLRCESRMLSVAEWQRWESWVQQAVRPDSTQVELIPHGIKSPWVDGRSLAEILSQRADQDHHRAEALRATKRMAVQVAVRSLVELHAKSVELGGSNWPLSHGDATADNVIVDLRLMTATWIDFDLRHLKTVTSVRRQADDLRALSTSVIAGLVRGGAGIEEGLELMGSAIHEVQTREILVALRDGMLGEWREPSPFHLAQSLLTRAAFQRFRSGLLERLAEVLADNV